MTLHSGRPFLSIPGPTTVPDEVLSAMHRPAVDIYGGGLEDVTDSCLADLKGIFGTSGNVYIFIANGHGAWEAALVNVLSPGDKVLVAECGLFATVWGEMAERLGLVVETLKGDWRASVDSAALGVRLRADTGGEIKAVLTTQVDTASGAVNDIAAIRAAMDDAGHDALLMVDVIASLATMEFAMDAWGVDVAVGGSQKGLMTPPGLSFNAAGPKAKAAHALAGFNNKYWDWTGREGEEHYMKYCGTPPVHMLFGLRKALDMILAEGMANVIERHRLLGGAVRVAVNTWAKSGLVELNVAKAADAANSVTAVIVHDPLKAGRIIDYCRENLGVTLGIAIGAFNGRGFRIGHMGHINAPMLLGTLAATEMALLACGMPPGASGVAAAVTFLAEAVPHRSD